MTNDSTLRVSMSSAKTGLPICEMTLERYERLDHEQIAGTRVQVFQVVEGKRVYVKDFVTLARVARLAVA